MGEVIPGLESYVTPMVPGAPGGGGGGAAGGAGAAGSALQGAGAAGAGAAGSLGGLLGPIATVGGALAGAAGNDQSQSVDRKMDPRMDKYLFDDLFPRTQGLLAQQMPQAQQTGDQLRNVGMGLLNMPVAGNGFAGFYNRGR
jgi:hypothetical protein